jgi:RNA polymerase sigma-70 factor (ECF subfamily)
VKEEQQQQIFKEWLTSHKALIFKIVRAYTLTSEDQDDLFQEIIIQVWHSVPAFRNESSVITWLYRISLNTAIKWKRKEKKYYQEGALSPEENILQDNKITDDRLAWLYEEIHKLDEVDRSITLLLLDGFSYKEIAAIIGITESHVGVKINRIKKILITKSKNYERV